MARTEADSWDLASSVGATATMVAAGRALASTEPDPLIDDPYAAPLVRAVGIDFFTGLVDGAVPADETTGLLALAMAVRTKFFDDFLTDATAAGIRQAIILASGLDARAYRLPWPAGTVVFELDQPEVIGAKSAAMTDLGAVPSCDRRTVAIDLRDDWPAALRAAGFDADAPTAWIAEGLLAYLPPEAQDRLFDDITSLSAPGSRLATEFHPDGAAGIGARSAAMKDAWGDRGPDVDLAELIYPGERQPVDDYLRGHGWAVDTLDRATLFERCGREFPDSEILAPMRQSLSVTAVVAEESK